ncbi:MAG: uncharacterized protein KVP18_001402 [Porospora cf. gigantea A]|uniref:uncharacterized protein n=1 Tax=Porospora cf. gigantea A TaxID=2853593 RepID=UPI0035594C33|nr:MAG: hypothetical protein KVP18_001402 [Porospora cf. gigantea A]
MASQFQVEHEGDVVVCNVDSMNSDSFLGALQSQWKGLKTMVETATSASVFLHARDDLAVTGSGTYIEDYQKCVSQIQQKSETPTLYVLSASNGSPRMLQNAGLAGKELEWPHVIWMVPVRPLKLPYSDASGHVSDDSNFHLDWRPVFPVPSDH